MQRLMTATGQGEVAFALQDVGVKHHIVYNYQMNRIRNNTDFPCYLTAKLFTVRYDVRECGVDELSRFAVSNLIMDRILQYKHSELSDANDATVVLTGADVVEERHSAFITFPSFASYQSRQFRMMFRELKSWGKTRIDAGETRTYVYKDKRRKTLIPEIHTTPGTDVIPFAFAGRTKFILFQVHGALIGTKEVAGSEEDDEKVGSSTFKLHHEQITVTTLKSFTGNVPLVDYQDLRPLIATDDAVGIVDEQMALDQIEE